MIPVRPAVLTCALPPPSQQRAAEPLSPSGGLHLVSVFAPRTPCAPPDSTRANLEPVPRFQLAAARTSPAPQLPASSPRLRAFATCLSVAFTALTTRLVLPGRPQVMIWGRFILAKRYTGSDYAVALAITAGCTLFMTFGTHTPPPSQAVALALPPSPTFVPLPAPQRLLAGDRIALRRLAVRHRQPRVSFDRTALCVITNQVWLHSRHGGQGSKTWARRRHGVRRHARQYTHHGSDDLQIGPQECAAAGGVLIYSSFSGAGEVHSSAAKKTRDTSVYGMLLMAGYLGFDGFTSTFQDKLFKGYQMETYNQAGAQCIPFEPRSSPVEE